MLFCKALQTLKFFYISESEDSYDLSTNNSSTVDTCSNVAADRAVSNASNDFKSGEANSGELEKSPRLKRTRDMRAISIFTNSFPHNQIIGCI